MAASGERRPGGFPRQGIVWVFAGLLLLAGVLLFLLGEASSGGTRFGWGMMYGGGAFGYFALAGGLIMAGALLVVVLLVLLFVRAANALVPERPFPVAPEEPLAIVRRRYAEGDISKEQFEQMTRDLTSAR